MCPINVVFLQIAVFLLQKVKPNWKKLKKNNDLFDFFKQQFFPTLFMLNIELTIDSLSL